jgi:YVTN family beta-propeller protein
MSQLSIKSNGIHVNNEHIVLSKNFYEIPLSSSDFNGYQEPYVAIINKNDLDDNFYNNFNKFEVYKIETYYDIIIATIVVGSNPIDIVEKSGYVWVTNNFSDTVSKIDIDTNIVVATITTGINPRYIDGGNGFMFVTNETSTTLTKINIDTNNTETITLSSGSMKCKYIDNYIWVSLLNSNLLKININDNTIITTITLDDVSYAMDYDGTTYLWISTSNGSMYKINVETNTIEQSLSIGNTPRGLVYAENYVWCTNLGDDTIYKINATTGIISATITLDSLSYPFGICYKNGYIWTVLFTNNKIIKINTDTLLIVNTITLDTVNIYAGEIFLWTQNVNKIVNSLNNEQYTYKYYKDKIYIYSNEKKDILVTLSSRAGI